MLPGFTKAAVVIGIGAASLATSILPASAAFDGSDSEPPPDTTPYVAKPDLRFVSGKALGRNDGTWELTYSIKNYGDAAAGTSTTTFKREGLSLLGSVSQPSIAPGASFTRSVVLPRSGCWDSIRIDLDANGVIGEHAEWENDSWVVGISTWPCADAAKYSVKLVKMKALRTQEAADEPYVVFGSANDTTGTTRSTTPASAVADGETAYIFQSERCVFGTQTSTDCIGLPAYNGIGIAGTVMEHDSGDLSKVRETIAEGFDKAGLLGTVLLTHWLGAVGPWVDEAIDEVLAWFDDDEIGTNAWGYSPTELAERLPQAGSSIQETRVFEGGERAGDALYYVTLQITRTA